MASLETFARRDSIQTPPLKRKFKPDDEVHARGATVYNRTCVACHGIDGKGVPETFPPLDRSDWVTSDPELSTKIVLHGLYGPVDVMGNTYNNVMAPLGSILSDNGSR